MASAFGELISKSFILILLAFLGPKQPVFAPKCICCVDNRPVANERGDHVANNRADIRRSIQSTGCWAGATALLLET